LTIDIDKLILILLRYLAAVTDKQLNLK